MHLDLTEVLRGPGHSVEKPIEIPAGNFLDEWELTEPVIGWVSASNARRHIVVRGQAQTSVTLQCGRCLCDYSQPLDLTLDIVVPLIVFNAQLGAAAVGEKDDDENDELSPEDIAALFQEHHLDVDELVRQAIVLAAPIQPLCRPDCPGLPEAEDYRTKQVDPRWASLQTITSNHNGRASSDGAA